MDMSGRLHDLAALPPGKNFGSHRIRCWVGLGAGLEVVEKR